jgi:hypothetical protein
MLVLAVLATFVLPVFVFFFDRGEYIFSLYAGLAALGLAAWIYLWVYVFEIDLTDN